MAKQACAKDFPLIGRQRRIAAIGKLEKIFDALTERGDAGIMHAHFGFGQRLRGSSQQAGTVGTDQGQLRALARVDETDARCHLEVAQVARQAAFRRPLPGGLLEGTEHAGAQFFGAL